MMDLGLLAKSFRDRFQSYTEKYDTPTVPVAEVIHGDPFEDFITAYEIWEDGNSIMSANKYYATSLVGPQGTGKTSVITKLVELAEQNGFKIIYALPEDYLDNIDAWLVKCTENPSAKNFLCMEDLSYANDLQSRRNQAALKHAVARFRHIFKGQMFVCFVTHRLHGAPPVMRNSKTWIFTDMQTQDRDDAQEIIGKNKELRETLEDVYNFIARVTVEGPRDKIVKFTLEGKTYSFRWGTEEDLGDGRLMACFHAGKLKIFVSKLDAITDLNKYRYIPEKIHATKVRKNRKDT